MSAPSLSLCMIIRDEARLLPRFLAQTGKVYDQLVAVDTGSRDESRALLAAAGAEVHEIVWDDDFAAARNTSLAHARGDWILVLDADEFPEAGFAEEIRQLMARDEVGAATVNIQSLQPNGIVRSTRLLRLFRNLPSIRYRYRIHEDVSEAVHHMLQATQRQLLHLNTPIMHTGYTRDELSAKNKRARDERLLLLALEDCPADIYAHYKLLELYRLWADTTNGQAAAKRCLPHLPDKITPPHIAGDLIDLLRVGLFPQDIGAGIAFMQGMHALAGHCPNYHLALGLLHEGDKHPEAAFACFASALQVTEQHPSYNLIKTRALMGLSRLSLLVGDLASARDFLAAARALSPHDPEVQLASDLL